MGGGVNERRVLHCLRSHSDEQEERILMSWRTRRRTTETLALLWLIVGLNAEVTAQQWRVTDRWNDGGTTRTAEADVRTGERSSRGLDVLLSYGCNVSSLGGRPRVEHVLLVAREPLVAPGRAAGPRTVRGSYAVDGTEIESNSRWTVVAGAEEFAEYAGPSVSRLVTHLIRGGSIVVRLAGYAGVQDYRFPLTGSGRAIASARRHCRW